MDTTPTTTFGLIDRLRHGDRAAFTPLFEKYQRRLAVFINYKLSPDRRNFEDVDDLLQETFLVAFEDIGRFEYRSPGSFFSWLSRIAEHVIVDAARYANRGKRRGITTRFRSESNPYGPEPVDSLSPSRLLAQRAELDLLFQRLNSLPEQYRQVILFAKIQGLSTKEMAERLGKSREAVALLLYRAIQRFRGLEDSNE